MMLAMASRKNRAACLLCDVADCRDDKKQKYNTFNGDGELIE